MKKIIEKESVAVSQATGDPIGLDLGDRWSRYCLMDASGVITKEDRVRTTADGLREQFGHLKGARIILEAGTHSPWASRELKSQGHDVIIANTRKARLIYESDRKNDRMDAWMMARLGRVDVKLLSPINSGRTEGDAHALTKSIRHLSEQIQGCDRQVTELSEKKYPETKLLQQVQGIGPLISLTYVLTIENPKRFAKSRTVGSYLGLRPKQSEVVKVRPSYRLGQEVGWCARDKVREKGHPNQSRHRCGWGDAIAFSSSDLPLSISGASVSRFLASSI